MSSDWQELTALTGSRDFRVSKVTLKESGISIEGEFELPPLTKLSYEDQVFISAFVTFHGSIKQMEQAFGVSYPTIKARLNKIAEQLKFVQVNLTPAKQGVLDMLEKGEQSVQEAIERLRK